tara:strand:+ start:1369 stop:1776 length:408 start_codon:yes stop_codon:yes gene_type:complete
MEEKLKKFSEEFFGKSMEFLNLQFVSVTDDVFTFSCEFNELCSNPMGFVQGGMITTALDDATSAAMISGYEEKKAPMTTDLHVLFHRPLPIGRATMEVKIIKLGSRSATSEGRIFNLDNKLVATLMHTAQPVDIN